MKKCDNTSAGEIIKMHAASNSPVAMIKRKNYPQAYAFPAGHGDGDPKAAVRETSEEVSLTIVDSKNKRVFEGEIDNPCKREGGDHHYWQVFEAGEWSGKLEAKSDAAEAFWAKSEDLSKYAARTEYFMEKYGLKYDQVGELTVAIFGKDPSGKDTDPEWLEEMGLEPVWYYMLKKIGGYIN